MDYKNLENGMNEETITMTAFIPTLPDENSKYIYRLSRTVRLLSILDLVFGIFMFIFGPIGMYIFVRLLCSLAGYYGSKNYDYCLTTIYLTFLIIGTVVELGLIYIYQELYQDHKITENILLVGICYQLLFFILKAYICRFVCIFASKISNLNLDLKSDLIKYDSQPVEIIYW
jgi:hypothetical protein